MLGQPAQRGRRAGAEHQQLRLLRLLVLRLRRAAVHRAGSGSEVGRDGTDHHVGVGPGQTEGADADQRLGALRFERPCLGHHPQRRVGPGHQPVRPLQVQRGGDDAVLGDQHRLDQPGQPGGGLGVAEVGLHRPGEQRSSGRPARCHRLGQRPQFDVVADRGAGAVRLHVVQLRRADPGAAAGLAHHLDLAGHRGPQQQAAGGAVAGDGAAVQQGEHGVAVAQRVGQPLEHHRGHAVAAHVAVGAAVAEPAGPAGRGHAALRVGDGVIRGEDQVDPRGDRQLALPELQALPCGVHGDQGGGAGGVEHDARTAGVQRVGDPARGDGPQPAAHQVAYVGLVAVGLVVVLGGRLTDEDADLSARQRVRTLTARLQRLPDHLQQDPLLRIHRACLDRGDTEEGRVESERIAHETAVPGDGPSGQPGAGS